MSLSAKFQHEGFVVIDRVLSSRECDSLVEQIAVDRYRDRAGLRNLMSNRAVRALAVSKPLTQLTKTLIGIDLVPYKATLFEKTGKANWLVAFHQDTALPLEKALDTNGWGPSSLKDGIRFSHAPTWALRKIVAVRVHLDASTPENGPLRVIPGTHNERVLDDAEFEKIANQGPAVECPVGKGGVIAMSPLIFHASSKIKNHMPRRVLHIEYAPSLDLGEGVRLAQA